MKVLFARGRISADLSWTGLRPLLPGWQLATCEPAEVAGQLAGVDVVCPMNVPISRDIITAGSFGLIHQFGVGVETTDVEAATELGVWVARVPGDVGGNADSVAELAILHLLALGRRLDELRDALTGRRWTQRPAGRSLDGATVAVIGLGAIGAAVARRLAPFGPRLIGVRARPWIGGPEGLDEVTGPGQLHAVLAQADAVVCCAMLHEGSAGMFGPAQFAAMRPGALFVNVARGGLVDEHALLAALEAGQVGGAGLDVYAREPADPDLPLLRHPRVIATPHAGWLTTRMFERTCAAFAASVRSWADGGEPHWPVNAPAFCRSRR
ncbi:MAG TPA: NAD(P)-dependent oxidoreductase [Streptosporangiaceae bacterium]